MPAGSLKNTHAMELHRVGGWALLCCLWVYLRWEAGCHQPRWSTTGTRVRHLQCAQGQQEGAQSAPVSLTTV